MFAERSRLDGRTERRCFAPATLISPLANMPLELHFAVLAYDRMSAQRNAQTADLAKSIYQKYISLRTASSCFSFIPHKLRQEIGIRLKQTGSAFPDARLFSPILPYLDSFLRQQHEQFVCSEEFLDAFNRVNMGVEEAGDNISERRRSSGSKKPQLTAEMLMKSRHDREHVLGERKDLIRLVTFT
ncbi:unnamed protein product [Cylicostephanus goldi]|uniref:RGS domain-containing protein n=1 Tax=Cylicostephanus goldi TaxID=71465 RepID=A0A3P6RT00_CYLGO|nr:unnamed protein product [Cylicostephanus goldi]